MGVWGGNLDITMGGGPMGHNTKGHILRELSFSGINQDDKI